jgi:hypothetical protein
VPRQCLGLSLGRSGNRVRKASPSVGGAHGGAISRSTWRRRADCGDSGASPNAVRSPCGQDNRCRCPCGGVPQASRIETVAPQGDYLGKIGMLQNG